MRGMTTFSRFSRVFPNSSMLRASFSKSSSRSIAFWNSATIPVGVNYRLDGAMCEEVPAEAEALARVQPVYEEHPGWQQSTGGARRLADLPRAARAYLDRLESLSGVPVRYVSVGTRRDQIIEV